MSHTVSILGSEAPASLWGLVFEKDKRARARIYQPQDCPAWLQIWDDPLLAPSPDTKSHLSLLFSGSQSVVPGPAAAAPENLLKMQILGPYLRPA